MKKIGLTEQAIKGLEKQLQEEKIKLTSLDAFEKANKKRLVDNNKDCKICKLSKTREQFYK